MMNLKREQICQSVADAQYLNGENGLFPETKVCELPKLLAHDQENLVTSLRGV